jgi:hypothetical protein
VTRTQVRRSMIAGIGFVVLFVVGVFVTFGNSPDVKSKDSAATVATKYVTNLSSSSHRTGILIGAYLIVVAALLFVWFAHGLRAHLAPGPAARIVTSLAVIAASAMMAAAMASAAWAGDVSFGGDPVPRNGDAITAVANLFFPLLFVVFALTSAAIIGIVAVGARRSGLPAWLFFTAWLAVLGAIFAVIFLPMVLPLLWYLAVAITLILKSRSLNPSTASAESASDMA